MQPTQSAKALARTAVLLAPGIDRYRLRKVITEVRVVLLRKSLSSNDYICLATTDQL